MSRSSDLARTPSADVVLWGFGLLVLGLAMAGFGAWRWVHAVDDDGGAGMVLAAGGVVALVGLALAGTGVYRVAEKVDDVHRIAVLRHEGDQHDQTGVGRVGLEPTTDGL